MQSPKTSPGRTDAHGAGTATPWSEFRRGLIAPSRPALALTLTVALASWGLLGVAVTPDRMASFAPYLAASRRDTCAFVTGRIEEVRLEARAGRPAVAFVGASGLRDAITGAAAVEDALARRHPESPRVPVHWLVTDGQNVLETASLIEALPAAFEGVLVIGVNPFRLGHGLAPVQEGRLEYRLGFRSRILERESAAAGIPLAPSFGYFWDGYRFFLPRLRYAYKNFKRGAPDEFPRPPQREGGRHAQEDAWQWFAGATDGLAQRWDGAARRALGPLAEVIEALPGRDRTTVVLLQGPVSERALRDVYGEELFARYRRDIEAYAAQYGYEYWSLADDAELTQADFYDWGHLNSAGARERFTAVLADRLASVLDEP